MGVTVQPCQFMNGMAELLRKMSNAIAYQNKDITAKFFADRFKGKSLKVYGFDVPPVKQVLPTNIPQIRANELKMDNVFLLMDDTIALLDYESTYKEENKHKYIRYMNHVVEYYKKEWGRDIFIRMIVIYTADVERTKTSDVLDAGSLKMEMKSAYLSELDSKEIFHRLEAKAENGIAFTEEELMEFIVLPLMYKGNDEKNECIKAAIEMASKISDEEIKVFLLSGVAVFANKVIIKKYADEIGRMISMTKVGQYFEEEKLRYAENYAKEYAKEQNLRLLVNMIESGKITEELAAEALDCSVKEFKQMRESLMQLV